MRWGWLLAAGWLLVGCFPPYRRELATPTATSDGSVGPEPRKIGKVRALAADMLTCPRDKVDVGQIDAETFNVGGCGKTMTVRCFKAKGFACHEVEERAPASTAKTEAHVDDIDRPFDREAARRALQSIVYDDCGKGGGGKLMVTFDPSGKCASARVTDGEFEETVRACIEARFAKVSVPPFDGAPRTVRISISLPPQ